MIPEFDAAVGSLQQKEALWESAFKERHDHACGHCSSGVVVSRAAQLSADLSIQLSGGLGACALELSLKLRRAYVRDGLSGPQIAGGFGISRASVANRSACPEPPGHRRTEEFDRLKLNPLIDLQACTRRPPAFS